MMRSILPAGSRICEIGVWKGEFASQLLTLNPRPLILIDPFQGVVSSGNADGNNVEAAFLPSVYISLAERTAHLPNVLILRGFSQEFLPMIRAGTLDAVYIDGDHSYEGAKQDLALAWNAVKEGGYICGHDYEMNPAKTKNEYNFGVKRAVTEFCDEHKVEIVAKGMDGQVSFAILKRTEPLLERYVETGWGC